ncbi:MFS transporter [Lihuaxuella thermophila]|uniref:MFS transporter, DHA2 family, metal-tetracycline-proton antiporter n=1 Tax=Lihuaxuella thermophila TaxID=1173111 RepID=A0A1H8ERQ2_9BACL|nr:MFS transporter [Lihuaxuella thermophila]SEN22173.1 MFS transporter, DHA2 family, metal-tetracycline-proton antiporter [Lihuaxuella thermophila]
MSRHHQQNPQVGKQIIPLLGCLLLFSVMNVTVFNVAVPDIAKDLGLTPSLAGWVITGYAMVYAIGSLMYGKLADLFPLKRLMTIGITLFAAGSVIGFFLDGYMWLLIGRLVQSAGASCVPALAMIIPARYFPPERRGTVMGVVASFIAFSSGIGPIVGGFVTGALHWKYLFLLSLGTLLLLPFLRKALPNEERRDGSVDAIGAGLLAAAVAMLMMGITTSGLGYIASFAGLLALFIAKSRKSHDPFVSLSLFTEGPFRYAIVAAFLSSSTGFSMMLIIPLMLKSMFQLPADQIGFVLFPAAMGAALFGRIGGKWVDRFGSIPMMLIAASFMIIGFILISLLSGFGPVVVACSLILPNIGFTLMQSSLSKLVSLLLPREKTGSGMGIFSLTGFLAGAIGGTLTTKAVDWNLSFPAILLFFAIVIALQMCIVFFVLRGKVSRMSAT